MNDGPPLYQIEWEDTTCDASWHTREELKDFSTDRKWRVFNVGYLVHEDEDCVVLAARIAPQADYTGLLERIPVKAILNRKRVTAVGPVIPERHPFPNEEGRDPETCGICR